MLSSSAETAAHSGVNRRFGAIYQCRSCGAWLVICLDAKSGQVVWGPERTAQGIVSASPILADNKVYITNEQAITTVLAGGPDFKVLATNELDGSYTLSSPAVSDNKLFLRTADHLYCIGETD